MQEKAHLVRNGARVGDTVKAVCGLVFTIEELDNPKNRPLCTECNSPRFAITA